MSGARWPTERPRNPFRLLRPAQHHLARARRAGVDTSSLERYDAWRAAGRPKEWTDDR